MMYDFLTISVGLDHLLMMAAALNRASCPYFLSHQGENLLFASCVCVFKFFKVLLDEGNVFDSLDEAPHTYLPVMLLLMALADLLNFFLADSEQRFAGPGTLNVRSASCDGKVFVHSLIL